MHPLDDVYNGIAGRYSDIMSQASECPRSFWYFAFLTCLGSVISNKVTLPAFTRPQPRLYTLILGESAWTRKSTAITHTVNFFRDTILDFRACWGVGSPEGLAEEFKDADKVLLVQDEFSRFVHKAQIKASVLREVVNTLFESNRYQNRTKQHNIDLQDVHLSILAASTVETYQNMWDPKFTDIGFLNRIFIVKDESHRRHSIPLEVNPTEQAHLKRHLGEILQVIEGARDGEIMRIPLDAEAGSMWDDWYHEELAESIYSKRLDTYGHRLMILLTLNNGDFHISVQTIQKVIRILEWQHDIRKKVDPIQADNKIARMEQRIRNDLSLQPGMTSRDLKRAVRSDYHGLWVFKTALNNLIKDEEVTVDEKDRRKKRYYLVDDKSVTENVTISKIGLSC